jgi:hypothetical protein
MPRKNKVSVTTEPTKYRLSSSERRAAQLADIAGKQGDLKREAAERRAKRAEAEGGGGNAAEAPAPGEPGASEQSDTP